VVDLEFKQHHLVIGFVSHFLDAVLVVLHQTHILDGFHVQADFLLPLVDEVFYLFGGLKFVAGLVGVLDANCDVFFKPLGDRHVPGLQHDMQEVIAQLVFHVFVADHLVHQLLLKRFLPEKLFHKVFEFDPLPLLQDLEVLVYEFHNQLATFLYEHTLRVFYVGDFAEDVYNLDFKIIVFNYDASEFILISVFLKDLDGKGLVLIMGTNFVKLLHVDFLAHEVVLKDFGECFGVVDGDQVVDQIIDEQLVLLLLLLKFREE